MRLLPGRAFTLRQLLRHDAGLRDYTAVPDYLAAATSGGAPWSEIELLARVEVDRLAYPPGDGWTYSNVGYLLVRRAIEAAFGADLEAALQALVFAPLGVARCPHRARARRHFAGRVRQSAQLPSRLGLSRPADGAAARGGALDARPDDRPPAVAAAACHDAGAPRARRAAHRPALEAPPATASAS